jgi:ATP-dependent DNA helicase RecG
MLESDNVEFKLTWKDEYLKWICGFANASGGKLYIGLDDSGHVVGLIDAKRLLEEIPNKIVNYLGIVAEVRLLDQEGHSFLEINVVPSSIPVSYKGSYHYRSGSTKQELKGAALNQFLLKRMGRSWDDLSCENATLNDIDTDAVDWFMKRAFAWKRIENGLNSDDLITILDNLNLIADDGRIKNAAILLFGKRPSRFFPSVSFKIGRFINGDDDLHFQDIIEGNIIQMADRVMDILNSKYTAS